MHDSQHSPYRKVTSNGCACNPGTVREETKMKLPISIGTLVININKKHGDYFTQGVVIPPAFKGDQFINVELKYYDGSTRISIAKPWELKELTNNN